jgi:hypothetical protein
MAGFKSKLRPAFGGAQLTGNESQGSYRGRLERASSCCGVYASLRISFFSAAVKSGSFGPTL